jgi:hypothetical protein
MGAHLASTQAEPSQAASLSHSSPTAIFRQRLSRHVSPTRNHHSGAETSGVQPCERVFDTDGVPGLKRQLPDGPRAWAIREGEQQ